MPGGRVSGAGRLWCGAAACRAAQAIQEPGFGPCAAIIAAGQCYFAAAGLFTLTTAWQRASQSDEATTTGEPCGGEPHARFRGREGVSPSLPLSGGRDRGALRVGAPPRRDPHRGRCLLPGVRISGPGVPITGRSAFRRDRRGSAPGAMVGKVMTVATLEQCAGVWPRQPAWWGRRRASHGCGAGRSARRQRWPVRGTRSCRRGRAPVACSC